MAIYLIGGPPKCGKTTLAKEFSKRTLIPWISADTLENVVFAYSPQENHTNLFPHHYLRGDSNDEFYSSNSTEKIIQDYIEQGKSTYEAINVMAQTYLTDQDDFIVEGYQVTPEVVSHMIKEYGSEHVKAVFLVRFNEEKFLEDLHKSTTPNDWILRKTKEEATYAKISKMVSGYSRYFKDEAKKYALPVFSMDNDFTATIDQVIEFLKK